MSDRTISAPTPPMSAQVTGWDRLAILLLGAAGCALSYDALRQMATAIHVRSPLTYVFPLVIDGFIAYGVRALLVMRHAPFFARLYVWVLFGTATAASIWANALHAVRLNDEQAGQPVNGLRLGDGTVGVLSTIAPLALAGAVHLYILMARRRRGTGRSVTGPAEAVAEATDVASNVRHPHADDRSIRLNVTRSGQVSQPTAVNGTVGMTSGRSPVGQLSGEPELSGHEESGQSARSPLSSDRASASVNRTDDARGADRDRAGQRTTALADSQSRVPGHALLPGPYLAGQPGDRPTGDHEQDLLPLARVAVAEAGRVTRAVVAQAIRGQGMTLSSDRLTVLMQQLRQEAVTTVTLPVTSDSD